MFFNDQTMFHTASPVVPRCGGHETWRDMVIVDILAYHARSRRRSPTASEVLARDPT